MAEQPWKAYWSIVVILAGRATELSLEQREKVDLLIVTRAPGSAIEVREEHPAKA